MEEAAGFLKLAVVALIAAVRAMQLVLARDGTTGQPVTDAVAAADMAALRQSTSRWKVALRSSKTRMMTRFSPGTPGSSHDWEDGPVIPRADTSRPDQRPCIMGSSRPTRSCSAGTWQIVPQMCDSRSPQREGEFGLPTTTPSLPRPPIASLDASPASGTSCVMQDLRQLPLPFQHNGDFAPGNFHEAASNTDALAWLSRTPDWPDLRLALWGRPDAARPTCCTCGHSVATPSSGGGSNCAACLTCLLAVASRSTTPTPWPTRPRCSTC